MKKLIAILSVFLFGINTLLAQVAINTDGSAADASAMLDVKSTTQGMLVPRMSTVNRLLISIAANGLIVFDTDTKSFWYFNGSTWVEIISTTNNSINELTDGITGNNSVYLGDVSGQSATGRNNVAVGDLAFFPMQQDIQILLSEVAACILIRQETIIQLSDIFHSMLMIMDLIMQR